jgi:hypothetical protein
MKKISINVKDENSWYKTPVQSTLGLGSRGLEKLLSILPLHVGAPAHVFKAINKEKVLTQEQVKNLVKKLVEDDPKLKDMNMYLGPMRLRDDIKEHGTFKGILGHPFRALALGVNRADHYMPTNKDDKTKGYVNIHHKIPSIIAHEISHAKDHAHFIDPKIWSSPQTVSEYYTSNDATKSLKKVLNKEDFEKSKETLLSALNTYAVANSQHLIDRDKIKKHWDHEPMKKESLNIGALGGEAIEAMTNLIKQKQIASVPVTPPLNTEPNDKDQNASSSSGPLLTNKSAAENDLHQNPFEKLLSGLIGKTNTEPSVPKVKPIKKPMIQEKYAPGTNWRQEIKEVFSSKTKTPNYGPLDSKEESMFDHIFGADKPEPSTPTSLPHQNVPLLKDKAHPSFDIIDKKVPLPNHIKTVKQVSPGIHKAIMEHIMRNRLPYGLSALGAGAIGAGALFNHLNKEEEPTPEFQNA